jgi:type I restriction-modification system DNA methylase subunit
MDFETVFPEVMKSGGFDAIVGNPPYIRIQILKEMIPEAAKYLNSAYLSAKSGNYDIYVTFIEKGLKSLNENGYLGFILPNKFFNSVYGKEIRDLITNGKSLKRIVHFGSEQIFKGATTYTAILVLTKRENEFFKFSKVNELIKFKTDNSLMEEKIKSLSLTNEPWNFVIGDKKIIFDKLNNIK